MAAAQGAGKTAGSKTEIDAANAEQQPADKYAQRELRVDLAHHCLRPRLPLPTLNLSAPLPGHHALARRSARLEGNCRQRKGHQQRQQRPLPMIVHQPDQRRHLGQAHAQPQRAGQQPPHSMRPMARNIHITLKNAMLTDGTANSQ